MEIMIRKLQADDIYPMLAIISAIGYDELKSCFVNENTVKAAMEEAKQAKAEGREPDYAKFAVSAQDNVLKVVLKNLPKCRDEVNAFLGGLAGMTADEFGGIAPASVLKLLKHVIHSGEFSDFFTELAGFMQPAT